MIPLYDNPIHTPKEDLYDRAHVVEHCANIIASVNSKQAFVVGISGPWGSGKTSFINLVKERLTLMHTQAKIVDFNPWLYSSSEQLLNDFFATLGKGLGVKRGSEIGGLLARYSTAISTGVVSTANTVIPQLAELSASAPILNVFETALLEHIIKKLGNTFSKDNTTLLELRNELSSLLEKQKSNTIIVIDDVDRLTIDETLLVFNLVNLTASFPHITFLLSYDWDVVTGALSRVQELDGATYLEKIVNLPIDLPPASKEALTRQVTDVLDDYLCSSALYSIEGGERARLYHVFNGFVMTMIDTPRKAKRYINKFSQVQEVVEDEICPVDLIGMSAVLIFLPNVTSWIWTNREVICGTTASISAHTEELQVVWKQLDAALHLDVTKQSNTTKVREGIRAMFPTIPPAGNNRAFANGHVNRQTGRVAHIDNLSFLLGATGVATVRRRHLQYLVEESNHSELCSEVLVLDGDGNLGLLLELIEMRLGALRIERKRLIAHALLSTASKVNQNMPRGFLSASSPQQIGHLLVILLRNMGKSEADTLITEAVGTLQPIDYLGLTYYLIDERESQRSKDMQGATLTEGVFDLLSHSFLSAILVIWPRSLLIDGCPLTYACRVLDNDLHVGSLEQLQRHFGKNSVLRVLSAAASLPRWTSGDEDGFGLIDEGDSATRPEPILGFPSKNEVYRYATSRGFAHLPDNVKARVAAYYLILQNSSGKTELKSGKITRAQAITQAILLQHGNHNVSAS